MSGRRVVVSGGGTGIGLATAEAFAADGDRVVLLGRREDVLRKAADSLDERHGAGTASWYAADLADPRQVESVREFITGNDAPVDVAPSTRILIKMPAGTEVTKTDGFCSKVGTGT